MLNRIFALTALLSLSATSAIAHSEYIGLQEVPSHLNSQGGWLIQDSPYMVEEVAEATCESRPCPPETVQMLWLEEILGHDESGLALFKVVDVLELPRGYEAEFEHQLFRYCTVNGEVDFSVFAIARYELEPEMLSDIVQAWRVNSEEGKFEAIAVDAVACFNPLPGGD